MSTLEVHTGPLRAAVAPYRIVRDLTLKTKFPHGLSIRVIEQPPVAALTVGAVRTAVAADGVVLGPALLSGSLPAIAGAARLSPGQHLHDASLLASLTVLGATPTPLAKLIVRAYTGPKGLTVVMRNGLLVYFGDGSRPDAKWLSLARVLADPSSAGASYVDVRVPERPAAGFPTGVSPPASSGSESGTSSGQTGSESTQALAEGLTAAVGGGPAPGSSSTEPASTGPSASASAPSGETTTATGSEASETPPAPGG
jgi:cell division protein FtsQ